MGKIKQNKLYINDKKKERITPKSEGHEQDTYTHTGCPPKGNIKNWNIYNKNLVIVEEKSDCRKLSCNFREI